MAVVAVKTNSFPVLQVPTKAYHHYHVFDKEQKNPIRRRSLIQRLQTREKPADFSPACPYDGVSNLFAIQKIADQTFQVPLTDRPANRAGMPVKTCSITLTLVGKILPQTFQNLLQGRQGQGGDNLMAITLANILIQDTTSQKYSFNRGSFFPGEKGDILKLGRGWEVWRGYYHSVRPSPGRLLVNIDVTAAVMYESGNLEDVIYNFLGARNMRDLEPGPGKLDNRKQRLLYKFLKDLEVTYPRGCRPGTGRTVKIRALEMDGSLYEFDHADGKITVQEYFRRYYSQTIRFPRAVALRTSLTAVIPIELCEVKPGQFYKQALPADVTSKILGFTKSKPVQRLATIEKARSLLQDEASPVLHGSGMRIGETTLQINGRQLAAPRVIFGNNEAITPDHGSWNFQQRSLHIPATIKCVVVLVYCDERTLPHHRVLDVLHDLMNVCVDIGMRVPRSGGEMIFRQNGQGDIPGQLITIGHEAKKRCGEFPDLIVAILPDSAAEIRNAVKKSGDVNLNVATQCLRVGKLLRANNQYYKNVVLKINVKLGGVNSLTDGPGIAWLNQRRTMVVGADVSHPKPGSSTPSVTALVSSLDKYAVRYMASTYPQQSRVEQILDLGKMFESAIENYVKQNDNNVPERIVFFRDGISEGEFETVARAEMAAIRESIDGLWARHNLDANAFPKPMVTYVVAVKRHHVRFFPTDRCPRDTSGNVPAGLLVDNQVTGPEIGKDFFLQSHAGILGTSRPTHYIIMEDGIGMGARVIQELAYDLCHCYARATKAVSMAAPVYYAHLVCMRANFHTTNGVDFSDVSTDGGGAVDADADANLNAIKGAWSYPEPSLKMYWM